MRARIAAAFLCVVTAALSAEPEKLVTRLYSVEPTFPDLLRDRQREASGDPLDPFKRDESGAVGVVEPPSRETFNALTEDFFREMGIPLPEGSSISYSPSMDAVVMVNTEENHTLMELTMSQTGQVRAQVEVVVTVYQAPPSLPAALRPGNMVTAQFLSSVPSNSLVRVSGISVVGRSGAEAVSSMGGSSLRVTPTIGPDERTIDLVFEYAAQVEGDAPRRIASSVCVYNGELMVLQLVPGTNLNALVTLTANLVMPNGKLIPKQRYWGDQGPDAVRTVPPVPDRNQAEESPAAGDEAPPR